MKEDEMGRPCGRNGGKKNAYAVLLGKTEGKGPVEKPRGRWEDNIKMYVKEVGWEGVDWISLFQDRQEWRAVVKTVMNHWVL
jgi:hypothetical protein